MSVGHGELGLRAPLRPFAELIHESASRKDAFLDVHGAAIVDVAWSSFGDAWGAAWSHSFDGVLLDVTGVKTLTEILRRVETLALCQATPGTYFYDVDVGTTLWVHLTDDVDPNDVLVEARSGFYFGTGGQENEHLVQASMGPEKLTDAGLNVWTLPNNLTSWTETNSGAAWTANRESTEVYEGAFSARLQGSGAASGSAMIHQAQVCVVGKLYRFRGRYMTPATHPSTATQFARFGAATLIGSDGRNVATDGAQLPNTGGRWRNFFFDVVAHESAPDVGVILKNSAATACQLYLDDLNFQRIYGYNWYSPRLQADGLPESSMAAADVYPGSEETGGGSIVIANGETLYGGTGSPSAYCEAVFGAFPFTFTFKPAVIRYGGSFQDGQEILDLEPGFYGLIQRVTVSDRQAVLDAEDFRAYLERQVPPNFFLEDDFPDMAPDDVGKRRAMLFGEGASLRPVRIDQDGTTLLGTYEVCDPTHRVDRTLAAISAVYAYSDETAAQEKNALKRSTLVDGTDYNKDLDLGQVEIIGNPGPFLVRSTPTASSGQSNANDLIDFKIAGTPYTATIPKGGYTAAGYAAQIKASMDTILGAGSVFTVTYNNTTHKFTIAYGGGAGAFSLLLETGFHNARNALIIAGFTAHVDQTGSLTYTGAEAVFTDPDTQHFIRVDCTGYRDDASGTYTGTPNALIELGPDVLSFLGRFVEFASGFDTDSFQQARTDCPQPLNIYLGQDPLTVQELIDRLEVGGFADIVVNGLGTVFYAKRTDVVPASAPSLFDRDYLEFESYMVGDDCYGTVEVTYAQDPSTGKLESVSLTNDITVLQFSRPQGRSFPTFLRDKADAETAVENMGILARAPIRHIKLAVKGQLMRSKIGDKVLITRDQALAGGDGLTALVEFEGRLIEVRKNCLTHRVDAVVHTNFIT